MVELHRDNRVQVMKQLLDGISRHNHAGEDRIHLPRRNVLITMHSNGKDLEETRVVMHDYSLSPVWSHKKRATVPNRRKNVVEELPRPPHPAECFGIWEYPEFSSATVLPEFCGWPSNDPIWDSHLAGTIYSNLEMFEQLLEEKRTALQQGKEQKPREAQAEAFRINAILRGGEVHTEPEYFEKPFGSKTLRNN
ncbi:hypothetical protein CcaCcLH18_02905 [Colletotrichum camelliae]|nr:hypothetical protein CcaCcLH18_02905 [Colletotrichum camelliae]